MYAGNYKPGDTVVIIAPVHMAGKPGVVVPMNERLRNVLLPNEVPIRVAMVPATRLRDEETMVYLLTPAQIGSADAATKRSNC